MTNSRVTVFDTTLRDGEQAPGCSMTVPEKLRLARQLDKLGVDVIEAGFPIASQGDFEAVRAVAQEIRRPIIAGLARAREEDISRAWEALVFAEHPRIHIFLATSDIHLQFKLKITREECLRQISTSVAYARTLCDDVEFSPEDATRSELDFLCQAVQVAVDAGATTINIPDTVGYTVPEEYRAIITTIRERVRGIENVVISVHCHNDLGMAVANTLVALEAGARQVECTINGIGERAGNAAMEEIVMATRVRPDRLKYETGINTTELYHASQLLARTISFAPQPNKAIVGANAFAHEAGIHQHGVLSNPLCYEIMTPESVGAPGNRIVLGKHSGRHALGRRYNELGFALSGTELDSIYQAFSALADRKKNIYDQDLIALLPRSRREPKPVAGGPGARAAFAN
ncbi:MAG TPA: 2-isopropylmalate synthase [Terriglobales bacterium]|jgi:2-isopropylmalate synthase|nr:2-isopropylmalate synthase [Terriglobales bacterium]